MKIKGIRTNCLTEEKKEVDLDFIIEDRPPLSTGERKVFQLLHGPTGYEGFYIDEAAIKGMSRDGWWACAGTKGRWDSLFIPAEDMRKAFKSIEETQSGS